MLYRFITMTSIFTPWLDFSYNGDIFSSANQLFIKFFTAFLTFHLTQTFSSTSQRHFSSPLITIIEWALIFIDQKADSEEFHGLVH